MFFRFAAALLLVALVSMVGVRLEKQTLEIRREVSVQYYQTDLLLELLVRLRLETQQLTAPAQLAATIENANCVKPPVTKSVRRPKTRVADKRSGGNNDDEQPASESSRGSRLPLMRFQHPFNPEGID